MSRTVTTVKTSIDGNDYTFTGRLSNDGKVLNCKKGMTLTILPTDTVTNENREVKTRQPQTGIYLPISHFLKLSKQIK